MEGFNTLGLIGIGALWFSGALGRGGGTARCADGVVIQPVDLTNLADVRRTRVFPAPRLIATIISPMWPGARKPFPSRRTRRSLWILATSGLVAVAIAGCGGSETRADRPQPVAAPSGCDRPYTDDSPWNRPIDGSPTYLERDHGVRGELTSSPDQYTYPVYYVSDATPRVTVILDGWYSDVVDGGQRLRNQRAGTARLPLPADAEAAAGSDAQIILIDPATGDEWGASNLRRRGDGTYDAWNAYHYSTRWSGVPPYDENGQPFWLRGAGVPYLAGLVRPCEIARGRIDHALAFAYDAPSAANVFPATKSDGGGPADALPEGSRLQLNPALTEADLAARGCEGPCLTIARALQRYGMYVIDNSGRPKVMLEYEGTANWKGVVDEDTVRPIPMSEFRVLAPVGAS